MAIFIRMISNWTFMALGGLMAIECEWYAYAIVLVLSMVLDLWAHVKGAT